MHTAFDPQAYGGFRPWSTIKQTGLKVKPPSPSPKLNTAWRDLTLIPTQQHSPARPIIRSTASSATWASALSTSLAQTWRRSETRPWRS